MNIEKLSEKNMLKVFLDANVILEVLLRRNHYEEATEILQAGEQQHIHLFTSSSVIGFIAYWLIKENGLAKAKQSLLILMNMVHTLDLTHEQLYNSLMADFKDVEDGIQYFTATLHALDYFVTYNEADFRKASGSAKVLTPSGFLKVIS